MQKKPSSLSNFGINCQSSISYLKFLLFHCACSFPTLFNKAHEITGSVKMMTWQQTHKCWSDLRFGFVLILNTFPSLPLNSFQSHFSCLLFRSFSLSFEDLKTFSRLFCRRWFCFVVKRLQIFNKSLKEIFCVEVKIWWRTMRW